MDRQKLKRESSAADLLPARSKTFLEGAQDDRSYTEPLSKRSDHLIISDEKVLFSFLARFAALFSIKVLCGFFFSCFLLSLPLLMIATPYNWV
jgi:hypothetical protein